MPMLFNETTEKTELGIFIPLKAVYPSISATEESLIDILSYLSRDDTILNCARINSIISGSGTATSHERQTRVLSLLCNANEIARINEFVKNNGGTNKVVVFLPGQMLELLRYAAIYCKNLPGDGDTFLNEVTRTKFLQAALIASELWAARIYQNRLSDVSDPAKARRLGLGSFRKAVEETGSALHLGITIGRGWVLFSHYLPKRYSKFDKDFLKSTGLTLKQYFTCLVFLLRYTFSDPAINSLILTKVVGSDTSYKTIIPVFLELESQTPDELSAAFKKDFKSLGYKAIRQRPILKVDDERAMVMDPSIMHDKFTVGPMFAILSAVKKEKAHEIFGAFGLAFEDYINDTLRRTYPAGSGLLTRRLSCNVTKTRGKDVEFEIDAVLNDGDKVIIFETKSTWLREEKILQESPEEFLDHLKDQYGCPTTAVEGEMNKPAKGLSQLAKSVGAIARKEWVGNEGEFALAKTIYPVLIVHDDRLGAIGFGEFFATEFEILLGKDGRKMRIMPLTIMTVEDLEVLTSSIGDFTLEELLDDYTSQCPDRVRSLHNFIAGSKYADKIKIPEWLKEKSEEFMDQVALEIGVQDIAKPEIDVKGSTLKLGDQR